MRKRGERRGKGLPEVRCKAIKTNQPHSNADHDSDRDRVCGRNIAGAQQPEPETPEQKAEKAAADTRYIVAAATSNLLRDTMRDPDSLKFEVLRVNEDATVVCMEYRARNGFGGLNRELMVVTKDRSSQDPSDWNKRCTKPMYDMMSAAK